MLAGVEALGTESVPLRDALGRVLARDVSSDVALPPWDNASMDGFAVRADDVRGARAGAPVTLRVTETVAAGQRATRAVAKGEAVRIMTGAAVPAGADSVVRIEDTDGGAAIVAIRDDRDAQRNIRQRGEDVRAGSVVVRTGTVLGPSLVGVLSSVGCAEPTVYRRPRVAILATGDELVPLEEFARVRAGERIVSSNSYSLEAAVRAAGGEPVSIGIAPDDPHRLADALRRAKGCDMIVTSGGVSVGDFDFTRTVIGTLGGSLSLWRVRMRPGAPLVYGRLFDVPWLGLPGNPVSALVTFELFGRPLLRTLAGHRRPHRRAIEVVLDEPITLGAPLTHYMRVVLTDAPAGPPRARLTGAQSSGMLTSMGAADALLVVPPDPLDVPVGTVLRAIPLDGDLGGRDTFPG
ncbi:MAG: MoeA domain protein domain [Gemmatimonadetes bacterium]|nr:MoeA domain protein domain [Gemmatimonadota bacterium]